MHDAVCLTDFEALARERLTHAAFEFLSGGAGDELTLRWNRDAFDRLLLRPRVLEDVSAIDTGVTLFGDALPHPVLLAPVAYQKLFDPDGEVAAARGATLSEADVEAVLIT